MDTRLVQNTLLSPIDISMWPKNIRDMYMLQSGSHVISPCNIVWYTLELPENKETPFFSPATLKDVLGIDKYLMAVLENNPKMSSCYSTFYIDKDTNKVVPYWSGGRLRRIDAPITALKALQLRLLDALSNLPVHPSNYAFISGKNVIDAAKSMMNKNLIIHVDLKDFFTSHTQLYIRGKLEKVFFNKYGVHLYTDVLDVLTSLTCYNGYLPQGSPVSPFLTVMLNYDLDTRIEELAKKYNLSYTRFADDLLFGGDVSDADGKAFVDELKDTVHPFRINYKKLCFMRNKSYPLLRAVTIHFPNNWLPSTQYAKIIKELKGVVSGIKNISALIKRIEINLEKPQSMSNAASLITTISETVKKLYPNLVFSVVPKKYYISTYQQALGLHIQQDRVSYPRKKYEHLRLLAMLVGIQLGYKDAQVMYPSDDKRISIRAAASICKITYARQGSTTNHFRNLLEAPINLKVFQGKVSYLKSVDPDKAQKLIQIRDNFRNKTLTRVQDLLD